MLTTRAWSRWITSAEPGSKVTVTNPTDAELVESCLAGRRESFDVIVERHQRHVYQLCYRFVGNHEDASDLAQDVFIRAYRGLKNFPQAESAADAVLRGERAGQVRAAIARLPRKQRATLILRVYHELPHDQIAGILGSSVGAVKANFFHALNNLKKLMAE
jgi:DNA-directed RNA polymerase specialized sigma24 family protein